MYLERSPIHYNPKLTDGTLVFRKTRVPVQALLDHLNNGHSLARFLELFPSVDREDAERLLELAQGSDCIAGAVETIIVGHMDRFALRIAACEPESNGALRKVDIFIDGVELPLRDAWAFVPHFASELEQTSQRLKSVINWSHYETEFGDRNVIERHELLRLSDDDVMRCFHRFTEWGETTDDVITYLIPYLDRLYLTYQMATQPPSGDRWEYSVVNGVQVRPFDLTCVLDEAAAILYRGLQPPQLT